MTRGRQVLSGRQLTALLVLMRLQVATIFLPSVSAAGRPADAWVVALVATAGSVPVALLVAWLARRYPGRTVIEFGRELLGRPLGSLVGAVYVFFFLHIIIAVSREVWEAYTASAMHETPGPVFAIVVLAVAAAGAAAGIEVLGRAAELLVAGLLVLTVLTLILPLNMMRVDNLLPVLSEGFRPVLMGSMVPLGLFAEVIVAWMLAPHLDRPKAIGRHLVLYVVISGAVLIVACLSVVAVFGPTADSRLLPMYNLARLVDVGRFLERVEIIPLAVWTFAAWLKVGLFLWVCACGIAQLVAVGDHRPLVYPLAFLAAAVAPILYEDTFEMTAFFRPEIFGVYACSVTGVLIAVLSAASLLRGRGRAKGPVRARRLKRSRPPERVAKEEHALDS